MERSIFSNTPARQGSNKSRITVGGGATSTPLSNQQGQTVTPNLNQLDFQDLYVKIRNWCKSSFKSFDSLKNNPRIWISQFVTIVTGVGGSMDVHGIPLLTYYLSKDDSTWLLKLTLSKPNINWATLQSTFIEHFEKTFSEKVYGCMNRKKDNEEMDAFVRTKVALCKSLFPNLSQKEINLFVLACISSDSIFKLQMHLHQDTDTLIELLKVIERPE